MDEQKLRAKLFQSNGIWWLPEGRYGAIGLVHHCERGKDGYRLYGVFTHENRFPKNEKAISLIKNHRGWFLKDKKQWFLPNCSPSQSEELKDTIIQLAVIGFEIDQKHQEQRSSGLPWPLGPLYKGAGFRITKYGNFRIDWF